MTDAQLALQAVSDAQQILEEYLEPRPRNNERIILDKLVEVLERPDLLSPSLGCRAFVDGRRILYVTSGFVCICQCQPFLSKLHPRIAIDRVASPCRPVLAILGLPAKLNCLLPHGNDVTLLRSS